ncbi:hypothetical protein EJB05_32703, partial [Eragrostis curvula]
DDTLSLTGPNRALSLSDSISFEFNLKIKGEDTADQDFSKGEIECHGGCGPDNRPRTRSLLTAGTETKLGSGSSVLLTRRIAAVPWGRDLVLNFSVPPSKRKSVSLEHDEEEWTCKLGTYELQVKIIWSGVLLRQRLK